MSINPHGITSTALMVVVVVQWDFFCVHLVPAALLCFALAVRALPCRGYVERTFWRLHFFLVVEGTRRVSDAA